MEDKITPTWAFNLYTLEKDTQGKIKKYFVYTNVVIKGFNTKTGFILLDSGVEVWYPLGENYFMEFEPLFDVEAYNKSKSN
jgi:hypothetical protein